MEPDPIAAVLAVLNDALRCDPKAVLAVLRTKYNCNAALAEHAYVVIGETEAGNAAVTGLGLLNGILAAALKEKVALQLDDRTGDVVGFVRYTSVTG